MEINITFLLYDGVTAIDVVGPYEVLSRLPNANVQFAAQWIGEVQTDNKFLKLQSTHKIDEIVKTDVLIIPGSSLAFLEMVQDKIVLSWIKGVHETTKFTASVCSGSIILAATGLLKGKNATSHWYSQQFLEGYGVNIVQKRYVQDGKIVTSAGASAGIDMAIFLASKVAGDAMAKVLQLMIEYDPQPPFDSGSLNAASEETIVTTKKKLKEDAVRSGVYTLI